ncbi:MAG: ATP phosphoribosyltransferase regulatory subunit [Nanoarchaeota archaeon]|nr:ATP phosphoribosyltransferase regulatory subunit [Nanoarchaeota archaeon]
MKTETVKGFNDYSGAEAEKREVIRQILVNVFEKYGFEPAETPIVEYEDFVKGDNEKDEAVSDIFKLEDKGGRKLALRYELTFPLKRLMVNKKLPYKRYQIGPSFRDEPVSANRFRQFVQCDVDTIGATIKDEAEIVALTKNLLNLLGIKSVVYYNNRKLLNEILDKEGIKNKADVMRELDKLDKLPEKDVRENLKKCGADKVLSLFKRPEKYFERYDSYKQVQELQKYLRCFGAKAVFLPTLARGLSYYNGTVFEVKTEGMKETITAGGSYMFNGVQSTGISFGLDRLSMLAKLRTQKEKFLIISLDKDRESIALAEKLRKRGKIVSIFYGKPSKALDFANSYGYTKVVFVGKKETKVKRFRVKIMKTGNEELLKI